MRITKIKTNVGKWFELKTPVVVSTPLGQKQVSKFYYNGFHETFLVRFVHQDGRNYSVKATGNHKFRNSKGEFIRTDELAHGEVMDAGWIFDNKECIGEPTPTMDMEVPAEHCYLLENGMVSHNTAVLMGGVSEGINLDPAMIYSKNTASGTIFFINKFILRIMKDRGVYDDEHIQEVIANFGSVQKVDWLSDQEKKVFKTAFEIDQMVPIRYTEQRQKYIDQSQSFNLFISGNESEERIAELHKYAFLSENIHSLYYIYSNTGVMGAVKKDECDSCQ